MYSTITTSGHSPLTSPRADEKPPVQSGIGSFATGCSNTPILPATRPAEMVHSKSVWQCSYYTPENDGLYPLRRGGERLEVIDVITNRKYPDKDFPRVTVILQFFDSKLNALQRARLYHENLLMVKTAESSQVIAKRAIKKGTCLGILAGNVVKDLTLNARSLYRPEIIPDGILAQMNTINNSDGSRRQPAQGGYNVEPLSIFVKTNSKEKELNQIPMTAFFAAGNIKPGEELIRHIPQKKHLKTYGDSAP